MQPQCRDATCRVSLITAALHTFYRLDFKAFAAELKKQKIRLTTREQDECENYFSDFCNRCQRIAAQQAQAEALMDQRVFDLYGLTDEEHQVLMQGII